MEVHQGEPKGEIDDFLREFCKEKRSRLKLWGEAAIPQWLAFFGIFGRLMGRWNRMYFSSS